MQIMITQQGFESFTGSIANVEFENGVSKGHVSKLEADTIGGLYLIEAIDDYEVAEAPTEEVTKKVTEETSDADTDEAPAGTETAESDETADPTNNTPETD